VESQGAQCPQILNITLANDTRIAVNGDVLPIIPGHTIVVGPEEIATRDAQFTINGPDLLSYAQVGPRMGPICAYHHGDAYTSTRPAFVGDWKNSRKVGSRCQAFPDHVAISYADQSHVTVDGRTWPLAAASDNGQIFTTRFGFRLTQGGMAYSQPGAQGRDACLFVRPDRVLPTVTGSDGEKIYLIKPPLPSGLTAAVPEAGSPVDLTVLGPAALDFCAVIDVDKNGKLTAITKLFSTGNADADASLNRWYLGRAYKSATLDGAPVASRELVRFVHNPIANPAELNDHCEWDYFDQHPPMNHR
jgi:hypothetical protein